MSIKSSTLDCPPTDADLPLQLDRDRVAQSYLGHWGGSLLQQRTQNRINWIASQVTGTRILDIGCSEGILAILLAREGFEVTGIDVNADALEYASTLLNKQQEFVRKRIAFIHGDIADVALEPESFDSVILGEILEHLNNPGEMLTRSMSLLKPSGLVIVTTPFGYHPYPDHHQTFTLGSFTQLLKRYCSPKSLSITDGYIRFTGTKDPLAQGDWRVFEPETLLPVAEQGMIDQQVFLRGAIAKHKSRVEKLEKQLALKTENLAAAQEGMKALRNELTTQKSFAQQELKKVEQKWKKVEADFNKRLKAAKERAEVLKHLVRRLLHIPCSWRFRKQQKDAVKFLRSNELFDIAYYNKQYPDISRSGIDPVEHYVFYGWAEFRNPNEYFDTYYYLSTNKDVLSAQVNPLVHFIRQGWKEARNPSKDFIIKEYLKRNPDVAATNTNPLAHYLRYGKTEGRILR